MRQHTLGPGETARRRSPNVLITPHIAGDSDEAAIRAFVVAGEQIRRFAAGQPLDNEVARD